ELKTKVYSIDSSANAVILCDFGSTELEGNSKGWFSFSSVRHTIIHILNKNGYDEANIEIPYYENGNSKEAVTNLKAVTYNLENGKVVETKLEKSAQFKENVDKNRRLLKFTMPQVKEGSIIEFQYEVKSDFIQVLDPWYFQSLSAPTLWSEFNFSVPEFFNYNFLSRGYLGFTYSENTNFNSSFSISDLTSTGSANAESFTARGTKYRWVIKNVPELKTENFTYSIRNHISRMEFQLASQSNPLVARSYRSSWQEVTKNLLESESFGEKLNANNGWMADDIKPLYANQDDNTQKAIKIFEYVRNNFKSTGLAGIYLNQTLKNVFKTKQGTVAEINLLLTAMLRYAGLDANPVLLSTTGHGYTTEFSPMINSMNYVVAQVNDGTKNYFLDGTRPRLGFNHLPLECYNGHARMVNAAATPAYFVADSLKEKKTTIFFIGNGDDSTWGGGVTQYLGYYESYGVRDNIAENSKDEFFKGIQKAYGATANLSVPQIDSLTNYDLPVTIKYHLDMTLDGEDILYINPTFSEGYKKNPFTAAERYYPVEMPYAEEETIISTIEVPLGYKVDEIPKQMLVKLDEEGKSFFEYRISLSGTTISLRNRIKIDRAFFLPEEYGQLREFFNLVVKKQGEQIVFKKIAK
ncbi:MAG: DUF3857 domain-containing protein, partial [Ginsengibacter sp.]